MLKRPFDVFHRLLSVTAEIMGGSSHVRVCLLQCRDGDNELGMMTSLGGTHDRRTCRCSASQDDKRASCVPSLALGHGSNSS